MTTSIADMLAPIVKALDADGYSATIVDDPDVVRVEISARPGTCEECLSPRPVVEAMLSKVLADNGVAQKLVLKYPDAQYGTE
jgi:hypothetical protein